MNRFFKITHFEHISTLNLTREGDQNFNYIRNTKKAIVFSIQSYIIIIFNYDKIQNLNHFLHKKIVKI